MSAAELLVPLPALEEAPAHTALKAPPEVLPSAPDHPAEITLPELVWSFGGLTAVGAVAGLGVPDAATWLQLIPTLPAICLGTALLSAPPLLVIAPLLDLQIDPQRISHAFSLGISRAGRLAWGLLPALTFGAATTRGALALWLIVVCALGLAGIRTAQRVLAAPAADEVPGRRGTTVLLSVVWAGLALVVGLRLVLDLVHPLL
jgi:hypothetical protein